jgi:hypothetical protein
LRQSIGKVYEILVYAILETINNHLKDSIETDLQTKSRDIMRDFRNISRLVLGVNPDHPEISQPARLYRVGTANAADAGLDIWANFGPAIQVKHITISLEHVSDIMDPIIADQVVIVCKKAEEEVIEAVLAQTGLKERIRGFITELDLIKWYDLCKSKKYRATLGKDLIVELGKQFELEFPPSNEEGIETFFRERGYDSSILTGEWAGDA